ncbi:hypothetical protein [Carnobacterium maltaromaticum]|uniref:hypothetical protein n=2 Tax=Carnobacterium maltaromaticum TaxID=2751 RepID=UPI00295EFB8A|nr:hypothetical protein [Carnobacterium maltaromaticum]
MADDKKRIIKNQKMEEDYEILKAAVGYAGSIVGELYGEVDKVDSVIDNTGLKKEHYVGFNKKASHLHSTLTSLINGTARESYSDELNANLSGMQEIMTNIVTNTDINDKTLKGQLTDRISELDKMGEIIKSYDETIAGSGDLSSPGTLANLNQVRSMSGIDKIAGAIEAKENRLKNKIKNDIVSDETLKKMITDIYGAAYSAENMEELLKYARYTMINNHYLNNLGKVVNGKSVTEDQGMLVIGKDGKCTFKVKSQETKWSTEFFNGVRKVEDLADQAYFKTSGDSLNPSTVTSIKPGGDATNTSDYGANASLGFKSNFISATDNNGNSASFGNVNVGVKVNNNGLNFGLDINALAINSTLIFYENDLYYYQTEFGIIVLSASIGGVLSETGFKLKTPGLIGISVGLGKVDKIDTNYSN